jgi:hypothetical protein
MMQRIIRQWHTYMGLILVGPTVVLILTGMYLLYRSDARYGFRATALCDTGEWIGVTNTSWHGVSIAVDQIPFPLGMVTAVSCTDNHIDVALGYGGIVSTLRNPIRWVFQESPATNGPITHLYRHDNRLLVATNAAIWVRDNQEAWVIQKQQPISFAQRVYEWHVGWANGKSFRWVWFVSGLVWFVLIVSGIVIAIPLRQRRSNKPG